jgi:formate hydrogenlyase transcriptional activator
MRRCWVAHASRVSGERVLAIANFSLIVRSSQEGNSRKFVSRLQGHLLTPRGAAGGTIFLDEIGELPLDTQVKLLRILQEQEFEPVGSTKTLHVDVRIIAPTNRDLEEAVREKRFRLDLFYRLNVFPITIPPLRARVEDIPLLVTFFLNRFNKKFGKTITRIAPETMERLTKYKWPGNIRELQNVIERAVILSKGPVLMLEPEFGSSPESKNGSLSANASIDEVSRQHIERVLRQTGGVIEGPKGAAKILNLHPNTLRSRMRKLGVARAVNSL